MFSLFKDAEMTTILPSLVSSYIQSLVNNFGVPQVPFLVAGQSVHKFSNTGLISVEILRILAENSVIYTKIGSWDWPSDPWWVTSFPVSPNFFKVKATPELWMAYLAIKTS